MNAHRWFSLWTALALALQTAFPVLAVSLPERTPSTALFPPWYALPPALPGSLPERTPFADLFPPWYAPPPAQPADSSVVEQLVVGTGAPIEVTQSTPPGTVLERAVVLDDGGATWFVGGLSHGQAGTAIWVTGDLVGLGPGLALGRTARLALIVRPGPETPKPAIAPLEGQIGLFSSSTSLAISKSDSPDPVNQGAELTYIIIVTNTGTATANQVIVTDTTPSGTVFVSANVLDGGGPIWFHGGLYPGQSGSYIWFTGDRLGMGGGLPAGASAILQFVVRPTVPTPDQTVLHNDAYTASAANAAPVAGADVTTTVNAPAFALGKVASTNIITAGERLTYTITLTNVGHLATSQPYTIVEILPAHTVYAYSAPPAQVAAGTLTWTLTSVLGIGQSVQVTFAVTVTAPLTDGTLIVNNNYRAFSAEVTPTVFGPPITTTVRSWPTLSIAKADSPDPVQAGALVTYTITVTNAAGATGPALGTFVTDTLPTYVQFVSCSHGCTQAGEAVTWTIGTLGVGVFRTLTLVGRVYSPLPNGTTLTNTAAVSATNGLATVTTSETTMVASAPAFTVTKTVYPSAVVAGTVVTYTIIVTNTGNETANNATVTDTLPAPFTFGGMVEGSAPSQVGADLIWTGQVITGVIWPPGWITPPGPLRLVFTATAGGSGTFYNFVTVTQGAVSAATGPTAPVLVSVPDLHIAKSDSPDPATPGLPLTYTIVYSNASAVPATGVVVTDTLPDFITGGYSSPPPSSGTIAAGATVTWNLGTLGGNASGQITLVVTLTVPITNGTVLTNTAGITCNEGSSAQTGPVTTTVQSAPAFLMSKTASHNPVRPADRVTYTIGVTNTGTANATGVVITDVLPAHTLFVDATPPYSGPTDGVLTWTVGTLNASASAVYTLVVTVNSPLTNGLTLTNTAFVTSAQGVSGTASAVVTVQSAPVLSVTKSDIPDPVAALGTLVYTVVFTNTGDEVATGVWLTDTLPANVTLVATSPPTTTQVGNTVGWNWGTLSPLAGPQVVVMTVTVGLLPDGAVLTNTATLDSDQTPPVTDTETTTVSTADLVVDKWRVGPAVIGPTGVVTFTIRVTNTGSLTATSTRITDTLPANFTAVYSEAVGATWDSGTVWTANLAAGASAAITLAAQAPPTPWGPVTKTVVNTATATTAAPEYDLTDNTDTATVDVVPGPPYTVTLVAVPDTLPVGNLSSLTATVTDAWSNQVLNGTGVTFTTSLGALIPPSGWTTTGGAATAQLTSTVAGTAWVTATAGSASDTVPVTFTAGAVHHFVFGPIADQVAGVDFTITITAYDVFNNVATWFTGTVTLSDTTSSLRPTTSNPFVNGVLASQPVSITVARVNQPIWAISGTVQSASNPFTVTADAPYTVTLVAVPATLPVGNLSTLTATVTDRWGNRVQDGTPVTFETSLGALIPPSGWTTTNGIATAQLTSTVVGTALVTATADSRVATTTVTFVPGPPYTITLVVYPTTLVADGSSTATLTATVTDRYGNPVTDGTPVTFTLAPVLGSIAPNPASTTNGVALATFTAGTTAGTAVITATADSRTATATITLLPGPPYTVTLVAVPATLPVGNLSTLTATVTDQWGNRVQDGTPVTFETSLGALIPPSGWTTTNGIATAQLTSTVAGTARVTATADAVSATTLVTFTHGPAVSLTISPRDATATAGDWVTYTAVATDAFGNSWDATAEVSWSAGGGNVFVGNVLSATVAGTWPVTGTLGSAVDSMTITITPGPVAALTMAPVADPQTAGVAFGLTVTATDRFGNKATNFTGTLALTDTTGTLAPTTANLVAGVATPSVTVYRAWVADRITATLTATPTILAVSNPFTVVANVPYTVTYKVPASLRICEAAPVTATVTDAWNNPVQDGTGVMFTATIGLIFAESGGTTYITTTMGGVARATLVAGTISGLAATWAVAGSASSGPQPVSIITPGLPVTVHLVVNPAVLGVGGTALLTATVRDCAANPVADGTTVDFSLAPALGTISPDPASTVNGIALATFTAGTTAGTAVITATADSRTATATITLIPGPPYTLTLAVHPTTLVADGVSTAALTATVTDVWGNRVADGTTVDFSLAPLLGTISPDPASTVNGIALATFTAGTVTGTVIITATAGSAVATATVTLVPIPAHFVYLPLVMRSGPNLVVESIVWSPTNPEPNKPVVVTVTVRNIGVAPAGTFWVDLYLDPSQPPAPGIPWHQVSEEGVAWRVMGLLPGEARTLRPDQGEGPYTFWRGYFAATPNPHILYAVVDTWPYHAAETVPESNENDNVLGPVQVHMQ